MDMRNLGLIRLMTEKMAWHGQRQEVLAQNVANADTPGYRGRDLEAFDFKREMRQAARMEMAGARPGHVSGTLPPKPDFRNPEERSPYETSPDKNNVVLEEQLGKIGQNSMEYQTVLNLYRKQVGMIRMALRSGGQ